MIHHLGGDVAADEGRSVATDDDLSALVASRLCHDLVGPVGAIANGVDLMAETGGGAEDVALVRQSVERAAALLRGLRLAFGQACPDAAVPRERLVAELSAMVATRRVHVSALGAEGPPLDAPTARLAALMAMGGRLLLGLSGAVEVVFSQDTALPLRVTVEGPKAALGARERAWLAGDLAEPPGSREVELALLPRVAASAGVQLTHRVEDARVSLCIRRL